MRFEMRVLSPLERGDGLSEHRVLHRLYYEIGNQLYEKAVKVAVKRRGQFYVLQSANKMRLSE